VNTRGAETNVRLAHGLIKLFTGYTFIDAIAGYLVGDRTLSLTPRHRINSSLVLEKEHDFRIGFEAYFTGRQVLSDRTRARSFWIAGISGEKTLGKFSLFINAENITDTRQSRFGPVVLPPLQNPTFAELYAPTEGRLFNGGIKIRF
jgi:hypothetical protein